MKYQAKLSREGRQWLVEFPDAPGCQTYGATRAEALSAAREALEGWLEAHLVEDDVPRAPRRRRGGNMSALVQVPVSARLSVALGLRWYRQREGLTVAQTAKRARVPVSAITTIEDPDLHPNLGSIERVFAGLGLRLDVEIAGAA